MKWTHLKPTVPAEKREHSHAVIDRFYANVISELERLKAMPLANTPSRKLRYFAPPHTDNHRAGNARRASPKTTAAKSQPTRQLANAEP